MASGGVLFAYIALHLVNHALGLVSLHVAEAGMEIAVAVWYSWPGTVLLYGAAATHFLLALWAVYDRRTFRLPPAELLRIALGFTLPILLIGHAVSTRLAWELFGLPSDYSRVVAVLWASERRGGNWACWPRDGCTAAWACISLSTVDRSIGNCASCCSVPRCSCRCSRRSASSPWDESSPPTRWRLRRRKPISAPPTRRSGSRWRNGGMASCSAISPSSLRRSPPAPSAMRSSAAEGA